MLRRWLDYEWMPRVKNGCPIKNAWALKIGLLPRNDNFCSTVDPCPKFQGETYLTSPLGLHGSFWAIKIVETKKRKIPLKKKTHQHPAWLISQMVFFVVSFQVGLRVLMISDVFLKDSSWWLNQPVGLTYESKWESSPISGVKNTTNDWLKPPPRIVLLVQIIQRSPDEVDSVKFPSFIYKVTPAYIQMVVWTHRISDPSTVFCHFGLPPPIQWHK